MRNFIQWMINHMLYTWSGGFWIGVFVGEIVAYLAIVCILQFIKY